MKIGANWRSKTTSRFSKNLPVGSGRQTYIPQRFGNVFAVPARNKKFKVRGPWNRTIQIFKFRGELPDVAGKSVFVCTEKRTSKDNPLNLYVLVKQRIQ